MTSRPFVLCLVLSLCLSAAPRAQLPAEKAEQSFKVSDGLDMKLWASEPLFVNPTSMDVDHLGRVWVCEAVNYRCKLRRIPDFRKEGDRIVILTDTKGEGKADKATVFYQGPDLRAPLGIAVAKEPTGPGWKVFVCQSPDILVFEDVDGDGKADGPPKKLLTNFGGFDHDHGVHGILIGPDMKLYFSVGDTGVHGLQSSDGKGKKWQSNSTDCRAGTIWRCDMDGKNLELLAHNFRNEYEPCVDSFGNIFVSDNDDDGNQQTRICYVMPGGNYGYHPRGPGQSHWHEEQPGVVPKVLRTYFGSPTGMCVYEGTLLPKKYQGQLLHCDAGPRHVRCYHLKPEGAGYEVEREDMVQSTDNWFRPSDVCVAPDGSVFVADWYDPGVGGHGMGDTTRGRVYRITPKGHGGYTVPQADLKSNEGVRAALGSPNLAMRYLAMAKLDSMRPKEAEEVLRPAASQRENIWLRARALWQLARLAKAPDTILSEIVPVLREEDPNLRSLVVRIFRDFAPAGTKPFADDGMEVLLRDSSAAVRREALLALQGSDADWAKRWVMALARLYDGKDRFYLEAIGIAVGHHDVKRREAILSDFDREFPEWDDKVADLVWELRPAAALAALGKRLGDPRLTAGQRARLVDVAASFDDPKAGQGMLAILHADVPAEVRARVLENLERYLPGKWSALRSSNELAATIDALMARPETRSSALGLIAAAARVEALPEVKELAQDSKQPEAVRKQAVRTLGRLPAGAAVESLAALATTPGSLADEALAALAVQATSGPAAADALKALQGPVADSSAPAAIRTVALSALATTRRGSVWLLDLHAKGRLDAALRPEVARLLRNSPYQDLRNKALVAFPPPGRIDPKKLPPIPALAQRKGDPARGERLLSASAKNDLQCLKCHTVRGNGGQVGPDLSMIGKKASKENLFESILYPSKAIADQFLSWQIETTRGLTLTGLLVEETADALTLRDGNGKDTKIAKKDIESRTKGAKSLMPEDLVVFMTEDDLVDLVAYLFELKTASLTPDVWHIIGPFDNGEGDEGLDKVFAPEKSVDLKATCRGKAGEVVWRTVRPDAKGYVDLQAHYAGASDNTVSYLYQEIESPQDQEATLLVGTDDGCKLWVNDKLVHTSRAHRAAQPGQDTVKLHLVKGTNRVLLKINNGGGPHGFYFTLLAEQELKRVARK